ncbi:MAG TPA: hypothetical protein VJ417_08895 [Candidatus Glassbacteria bacterium]|nr:hypothetical protein [Candidatus Glassbacteria bacterium]
MYPEPLDRKLARRNLIVALCLAAAIGLLVYIAIGNLSPEHASSAESILSKMK